AEIQLEKIMAEENKLLEDINKSADSKNENIIIASGMVGRYASVGKDLQDKYIQGLNQLQEAASILGGRISIASVSSSGGTGSVRGGYNKSSAVYNTAHVGGVGSRQENATSVSKSNPQMKSIKPVSANVKKANNSGNISSVTARTMIKVIPTEKPQQNINNIPVSKPVSSKPNQIKKIVPQARNSNIKVNYINKNAFSRLKKSIVSKAKYIYENVRCLKGGLRYTVINGQRHYLDDNNNVYRIDKELLPNTEYTVKGYTYKTDSESRIISASGVLRISNKNKSAINGSLSDIGKGDEQEGDERGHIIARQFDAINAIGNIIPQNWKVNRNKYRDFENQIAEQVKKDRKVEVDIQILYPEDSARPAQIVYTYCVEGVKMTKRFPNEERDD
nr:DNA/RNA non-specific endonuclease [Ruminococcus sp.]